MKKVDFLWNRTVVKVVDKLSSTSVDFIRSERELEKLCLYGVKHAYRACSEHAGRGEK